MMAYLQRLRARPLPDSLPQADQRHLEQHFLTHPDEVMIDGEIIPWRSIEEVEVAQAPDVAGPFGGLVRLFAHAGKVSYHLALYYGHREAVLNNISLDEAAFIVQTVAFYAPHPVRYTGPDGLSPVTEG